jgi:hypothetical protein
MFVPVLDLLAKKLQLQQQLPASVRGLLGDMRWHGCNIADVAPGNARDYSPPPSTSKYWPAATNDKDSGMETVTLIIITSLELSPVLTAASRSPKRTFRVSTECRRIFPLLTQAGSTICHVEEKRVEKKDRPDREAAVLMIQAVSMDNRGVDTTAPTTWSLMGRNILPCGH